MGMWAYGPWGNDTALDWRAGVKGGNDPAIEATLDAGLIAGKTPIHYDDKPAYYDYCTAMCEAYGAIAMVAARRKACAPLRAKARHMLDLIDAADNVWVIDDPTFRASRSKLARSLAA